MLVGVWLAALHGGADSRPLGAGGRVLRHPALRALLQQVNNDL